MISEKHQPQGDSNEIASNEFEIILNKIHSMMNGDPSQDSFIHSLGLEQLRLKAQNGPHKGKSVLWLLGAAAANDRPEALIALWKQWGNQITSCDLQVIAEEGLGKGKSVQRLLAIAAFRCPQIVTLNPRIGYWALTEAAATGELEIINKLLSYPAVEENFEALLHSLERASENGHLEIVDQLLVVANRE